MKKRKLFAELTEGFRALEAQRNLSLPLPVGVTDIRHVTKPGKNIFQELGFAPAEAKRLQAASRKQINDARQLK